MYFRQIWLRNEKQTVSGDKNIKWQKYFLNIEMERKRKEIKTSTFLFKKISISTFEGFKPFLCLEIRSPAFENICSEGTEVVVIQNIFFTTLTWGIITPSPRRCLHHLSGSTSSRRGQSLYSLTRFLR